MSFNLLEMLGPAFGCTDPKTNVLLRAVSSCCLNALRGLLAVLALLMAHTASPQRARRSATPAGAQRLRLWQAAAFATALSLAAAGELVEWLLSRSAGLGGDASAAPSPPPIAPPRSGTGEWLCGDDGSTGLRVWHVMYNALMMVVIVASLAAVYLAPTNGGPRAGSSRALTGGGEGGQAAGGGGSPGGSLGSRRSLLGCEAGRRPSLDRGGGGGSGDEPSTVARAQSAAGLASPFLFVGIGAPSSPIVECLNDGGAPSTPSASTDSQDDSPPSRHSSTDSLMRFDIPNLPAHFLPGSGGEGTPADGESGGERAAPAADPPPSPPSTDCNGDNGAGGGTGGGAGAGSVRPLVALSTLPLPSEAASGRLSSGWAPKPLASSTAPTAPLRATELLPNANIGSFNSGRGGGSGAGRDGGLGARLLDALPTAAPVSVSDGLHASRSVPTRLGLLGNSRASSNPVLRLLVASSERLRERASATRRCNVLDAAQLTPLILRWRTQLCLLMVYGLISMAVTMVNLITSLAHEDADGLRLVVLLIDRTFIFCHPVALFALFGCTTEIAGPISKHLMYALAVCLVGNSETPIHAFPRSASGYWG